MAKKAWPALLLWIAIGLALFAAVASARAETAEAVLTASKDKVKAGDAVTVTVAVKRVTDLYGVQFALSYDPEKLELLSSKASDAYSHFQNGCESCEEGETPIYPLLRKKMADIGYKARVPLMTFVFEAKEEGDARIELRSLKGVSTETYANEAGYNDLVPVALQASEPLTIEVKQGGNGNGNGNGNGKGNGK
ncbi:cohesin domain-containing protein [Paenibacillus antri]|uniref:cohesin domain-containing protein n=1 Tax=Paenibacillus antri TaxID=2582848 RepID=UPI0013051761|nr:cohesin domain-containing protein [Paenibacillus antri]